MFAKIIICKKHGTVEALSAWFRETTKFFENIKVIDTDPADLYDKRSDTGQCYRRKRWISLVFKSVRAFETWSRTECERSDVLKIIF